MLVQSTAQWAHQPLCEPHSMLLSQPGWKFKVLGVTMQFSPLFLGKGWHSVMCQGWGLLEREGWLSGWCPEHAKGPRSPSDEDQQKYRWKKNQEEPYTLPKATTHWLSCYAFSLSPTSNGPVSVLNQKLQTPQIGGMSCVTKNDQRLLTWTNATLVMEDTRSRPPYSRSVFCNEDYPSKC